MHAYVKQGTGTTTIIFLHGWPGDASRWECVARRMPDDCTTYCLDLPGWGKTPLTRAYTLSDYERELEAFIAEKGIERPVIVGHSFGGRVAIKFALRRPERVSKLILVASAGIEHKSWLTRVSASLSPFVPQAIRRRLLRFVASSDYLAADGVKRETLKAIVAENLEPDLHRIAVPTLLIWGDADHTTPLEHGRTMEREIPGARLTVIPGGDHGIPYRRCDEVVSAIAACL